MQLDGPGYVVTKVWYGGQVENAPIMVIIQRVSHTQQSRKLRDALTRGVVERRELFMGHAWQSASMIARDAGDFVTFLVVEIGKVRLLDQAKGVFMVAARFDHHTGVV